MELPPPARIETSRLVLRPWEVADAQRLKDAIDANLEHLRAWMPWAMTEPSELEAVALRIETFRQSFATGTEWVFAIFSRGESRVIGGIGLHPRIGLGAVEIGYWAQRHETRQGYITEAVKALTAVAFASPEIERVQIRCDPANVGSAAVPRRLGYTHIATLAADSLTPLGAPRDTMVWEMSRLAFAKRDD